MIYISPDTGETTTAVTFTLTHAGLTGEKVAVVGEFNGWDPQAAPMERRADGHIATVHVEAGRRYRFRYLTEDGRWFNDEAAHDYQPNGHGGEDSVLDLTGRDHWALGGLTVNGIVSQSARRAAPIDPKPIPGPARRTTRARKSPIG